MQVNNIQTYNNKPQFKALRLKSGSERYISSMPDKVLNKLDSIGNYLSETQFYHLDIEQDNFHIRHTHGEKLYLPILINNAGNTLIIKAKQGVSQISKKLKFKTTKEVSLIEEKIKNSPTQIERTAEIVKVLDDYEKSLINTKENITIDTKEPREEKINKLIKKYGI